MSVQVTVSGMRTSFPRWNFKRATTTWRNRTAPAVLAALKDEAPVYKYDDPVLSRGQRPGDLRNSIKLESSGGTEMKFVAEVPYAKYVITGTRDHPIDPVNVTLLHWQRGGAHHYARGVHHPGTDPNNFPERAIERVNATISRQLNVVVEELIRPEQA